ncbi:MAG TPA: TonB-dependent receptor, partial [Gemmatimonadaceae bacterium]|nr:TonB-dependent receptor [Gemmatimonadaceae bacterium]
MPTFLRTAFRLRTAPLFGLAILGASGTLLVTPRAGAAQTITGTIIVRVTADTTPISGAAIATGTANGVTDRAGLATFTLPTGPHTFRVTPLGFPPESLAVFVGVGTTKVNVALHQPRHKAALPGGHVAAAPDAHRTSDVPANVEVADRDAVEAQLDRSPGSISELLAGVGGVRVQPLSAGSAGAGIRIRGMPGRYTKVLMDGLPVFGATTEGLEPFQTSALGLQRVEITPGVTSALVGPTALSGVINLVSAPPTSPSEVLVNGTTREASDVAILQTHTFSPEWAATLVAGRHYQNADDPDGDGWAEISGYKRIAVRPRVYWSRSERSSWFMTGGWTSENRRSGTFGNARLPDFNRFSEDADTRRADGGTVGRIQLDTNEVLTVRASMTREWRTRWYGQERERNRRNAIFGDVALTKTLGTNVVVGGVALERDQY